MFNVSNNNKNYSKPNRIINRNQSFNYSSLARNLYPVDFHKDPNLSGQLFLEETINLACKEADNLLNSGLNLSFREENNKKIYFIESFPQKIVLRRCAENIKLHCSVEYRNRNAICKEIKCFLSNHTKYNLYKYDIKNFFESSDSALVNKTLLSYGKLSNQNKYIIKNVVDKVGFLPRGVEISPVLGEIILDEFDIEVRRHPEVVYYSRFVDDIFIITTSYEENFESYLNDKLPKPLLFNEREDKKDKLCVEMVGNNKSSKSFSYLGYVFNIIDDASKNRAIKIDISDKKIKSIKTKVSKALLSYSKDGDSELLLDRIRFLTSNRQMQDKNTGMKVPAGIYYNYSLITESSDSLEKLDATFYHFIYNYEKFFKKSNGKIMSKNLKRRLLRFSFKYGFENKVFVKFSLNRISKLVRIWK
ncbi:Reverse transcriptase (RNA-dependent DNA polymerase) [Oceanospirillum multiglobuliferum]|uniref:Reverse transcriptase domain-containing protein n=1 Tax=Oceanospirillum multiglobuliferum TaxID=64969 RepID=A0A1T4SE45_9GAMM|nr:antiviral reverse transcriptase Drt3a [Oceanospirillum multiglobuliferum]OPX54310.1 hypothetical protein BTE48_14700 [Oceanospirillum multiglobuliferum]SKA26437.1 Reverse transcriptase (RNA-dependent DNA polymerase) [Oceanospirillum multiglobuliferum]